MISQFQVPHFYIWVCPFFKTSVPSNILFENHSLIISIKSNWDNASNKFGFKKICEKGKHQISNLNAKKYHAMVQPANRKSLYNLDTFKSKIRNWGCTKCLWHRVRNRIKVWKASIFSCKIFIFFKKVYLFAGVYFHGRYEKLFLLRFYNMSLPIFPGKGENFSPWKFWK